MNNVQESAMNELLFGMTHEGEKLLANFNALQEALKFPSGEVGVLLENKDNLNLTDEELEAKMQEFTEEAADRDYQAAETNEERDQAKFKHMDDAVMYERYSQALDYRKNVEKALSDFDAQLKVVTTAIEKFNETGVINQVQEALREAEKNRRPGNEADKAYVDSLKDFVDFYNYYVDLCDGMRTMVTDRRAQFDEEFNAKRAAVKENNDKVTAEIEVLKAEVKDLDAEFNKLDEEEEVYLRTNDFENPRYIEIVNRKKEINARRSDLNNQISEKQALLQAMPSFDYNFDSYKVGQRDIINLDLGIKRYLQEQGDLETEMKKHTMDAKNRAPRFEYYIDNEGKMIASIVINGVTKNKTVGEYSNIGFEDVNKAVKDLLFLAAASSTGLDLNTVARFEYQMAKVTSEGLEYQDNKGKDTFKMSELSKYLYEVVQEKVKEDGVINDMRNIIDEPEVEEEKEEEKTEAPEVEETKEETQEEVKEETKEEEAPVVEEEAAKEEEPVVDEEVSEEKEETQEEAKKEETGLRVVSARPFKFGIGLKAGDKNDATRKKDAVRERYYQEAEERKTIKKIVIPLMVGGSLLGVIAAPAIATAVALGGSIGAATLLAQAPNIAANARKHKLERLAEKLGLKVGYNMNGIDYEMGFVSPSNPRIKLSNEEVYALGEELGVKVQDELDKIAGNKFRGKGDLEVPYKERDLGKVEDRFVKKYDKLAREFDMKVDKYYYDKTGQVHLMDIDDEDLSKTNPEATEELLAELEAKHVDSKITDYVEPVDYDYFVQERDKIKADADKRVDKINSKDYDYKLLNPFSNAAKYNARKALRVVKPDTLDALFDDMGGVTITPKRSVVEWVMDKFDKRKKQNDPLTPEVETVSAERVLEGEVIDEEVTNTNENVAPEEEVQTQEEVQNEAAAEEEVVDEEVQEETKEEEAPVESTEAPAQEAQAADTTAANPTTENNEDLDINEAIVNATTTAAPVIDEEAMEAERAATVQQAMAEDEMSQATAGPTQDAPESNDIQAYMEATIENVESTLPDLIRANPAEAEKFVINHPEHQELYNSIIESLGSEGLGSK